MGRVSVVVFLGACIVYAGAVAWAAQHLPEGRIPTHWRGFGGTTADGWGSREGAITLLTGLGIVVGIVLVLSMLLARYSATLSGVSVPRRHYWTRPDNIEGARGRAVDDLAQVGAIAMALLACLPVAMVHAAATPEGVLPHWFTLACVAFVIAFVAWARYSHRVRWAIPPHDPPRQEGRPSGSAP